MQQDLWTAVDHYVSDLFIEPDDVLDAALANSAAAQLPSIAVAPPQGKFLYLLASSIGAKRILEIGTLGGYSTIWLARALPPDGQLISLEFESRHAHVAERNLQVAGVDDQVSVRIGAAADTLKQMIAEQTPAFDFIFIDADKESYTLYLELSLQLARSGTVMIADNTVREGEVINPASEDPRVHGVRHFHELLAREKGVEATTLQTVGSKGYDGFTMIRVR
ncbi:O-methyltransferase [Planctomicrobium piriforme]|uniref:Predicted O-methyltransferase YrrM n=1 Tax=Planctomicrobium piriforme TaxID=1576369 RepID=A0A1I3DIL6_9PLAN|nr:O-methyltransferase [Planctomicrobium piriforme]SFH86575.1 Predicted O-methyltransferase YrrM [Planctomicrobium piriforme]